MLGGVDVNAIDLEQSREFASTAYIIPNLIFNASGPCAHYSVRVLRPYTLYYDDKTLLVTASQYRVKGYVQQHIDVAVPVMGICASCLGIRQQSSQDVRTT